MKLLVGLGNPGSRYEGTRHNAGFLVAERFAARAHIALSAGVERFEARLGQGSLEADAGATAVAVLLPQNFMNRSGESVAEAVRELAVSEPANDLLLVFDDVDLPFGRLRVRPSGGAGGHRGVESVIACLGGDEFPRLRVGVGRPGEARETRDHVLERFSAEESASLGGVLDRATDAALAVLREGCTAAMNLYNRAPEAVAGEDED